MQTDTVAMIDCKWLLRKVVEPDRPLATRTTANSNYKQKTVQRILLSQVEPVGNPISRAVNHEKNVTFAAAATAVDIEIVPCRRVELE